MTFGDTDSAIKPSDDHSTVLGLRGGLLVLLDDFPFNEAAMAGIVTGWPNRMRLATSDGFSEPPGATPWPPANNQRGRVSDSMTGGYPLEQLDHVTGRLVRGDPAGVIPRGIAKPLQVDRVNGEPLRNEGIHQRDVFGVMLQVKFGRALMVFPWMRTIILALASALFS